MGYRRFNTELFISESKKIHGDRYDYSKTNYVNSKTRVLIKCSKHGDFIQLPYEHLKGSNCKRCSATNWNEEKFIIESKRIHKNFYSYENCEFTIRNSHVFVTCPIHGRFKASAHSHLKGFGCRECAKKTWTGQSKEHYVNLCNKKYNGMSFLYFVKIKNNLDNIYKIGISAVGVKGRFRGKDCDIDKIILQILLPASDAWDIEKLIVDEFSCFSTKTKYLRSGNTECFVNPNLDEICYSIGNKISGLML